MLELEAFNTAPISRFVLLADTQKHKSHVFHNGVLGNIRCISAVHNVEIRSSSTIFIIVTLHSASGNPNTITVADLSVVVSILLLPYVAIS